MSTNTSDNFVLDVSCSADLAESQDRIVAAFEHEGISIRPDFNYFIKSGGDVPANLILEFLKLVGEHEVEHVLDTLTDAAFVAIGIAISKVRALLSNRTLFVHVMTRARLGGRVHYYVPKPPEEERALKAIRAFQKELPDHARGDVFWHKHRWMTAAEYFELTDRKTQ